MSESRAVPNSDESGGQAHPRPSRPWMPADYGVPGTDEGLLPWGHARERLERALVYWVGTVSPDGRPHVTPVWGVWANDTLFIEGSPETRRGRNLAVNPHVVVHLDSGGDGKDVVILHGAASEVRAPDRALATQIAAAYAAKYASEGYAPSPDSWEAGGLYAVRPQMVLAWTKFFDDATRWRFDTQ